jgi:hypothetical protein
MRHTGDFTDEWWKLLKREQGRNIPDAVVDGGMGCGWELPAILTQRKLCFLQNIDGNRSLRRWWMAQRLLPLPWFAMRFFRTP